LNRFIRFNFIWNMPDLTGFLQEKRGVIVDKLRTNQNVIQRVFEVLKTATYVAPTKFFGSQMNTELFYAIFSLSKSGHLWLIGENTPGLRCGLETQKIQILKRVLEALTAFQVYLELRAALRGEPFRWRRIVQICGLKLAIRLCLLHNNNWGIMCPSSEADLKLDQALQSVKPTDRFSNLKKQYIKQGRGESNPHGCFSKHSRQHLPSLSSTNSDVSLLEKVAETLYWARPLIYAILMLRAKRRKNAWGPLIVALCLHIGALSLLAKAIKENRNRAVHSEKDRRCLLLLFYLVRPPVLRTVTQTLTRPLTNIPALGWSVDYLMDMIDDLPNFQTFGES